MAKKDFICKKWIDKINKDYSLDLCSMAEFKNYLNKFIYSDLTDITSNVINSYIEGLKLKILIYLLNQKQSKKNIAREFDRVNPEFKCIKEHIVS
ncbi:MAG: hypothetical protein ACXWFZ_09715 [Nitrososphaeraceae archaeon]